MVNKFAERTATPSEFVEVGQDDIQYLWDATEQFDCKELWNLWSLRVARHCDVWNFTQEEKTEFFNEYSVVITKLRHAAETGYVFRN